MGKYNFYGWEQALMPPITAEYKKIRDPRHLYDLLSEIWCSDTCAPRLRDAWTEENKTLGQCSITAFLVQDIFGGDVYGILRPGGNYHCYNVIGDCVFDLTSEQFGEEVLIYENNQKQCREEHFAKEEKRLRYEYLKKELGKRMEKKLSGGQPDISFYKSIIDQDRSAIVICNPEHEIIYMNPAAVTAYAKRGGERLLGQSLLDCHNEESVAKIKRVVAWFAQSEDHNIVYTFYNEKQNKDVYMVALRDEGKLIGYYEKHEYRNRETMAQYELWD